MNKLHGGSIGGSMGLWKKLVHAVHSSGVLLASSSVKNIVQKFVSTSIGKFLYGTRVLREYTFHPQQSLKKVFITLLQLNLRKDINQQNQFVMGNGEGKRQSSGKAMRLGIRGRNMCRYFGTNIQNFWMVIPNTENIESEMGPNLYAKYVESIRSGKAYTSITGTTIVPITT